jgi:hypothetical protein
MNKNKEIIMSLGTLKITIKTTCTKRITVKTSVISIRVILMWKTLDYRKAGNLRYSLREQVVEAEEGSILGYSEVRI